jgi:hypothetical protein
MSVVVARLAGLSLSAALVCATLPAAVAAQDPDDSQRRRQPTAAAPQKPGSTAVPRQPGAAPPARSDDRATPAQRRAQPRAVPRHPPHRPPVTTVRGIVFIGGYYYDPVWGPYPRWPRPRYPYWYYPIYDERAHLRIRVSPDPARYAAVYVDGYYAGLVDEFDGAFQSLPLPPGGHTIVVYLEGYRTARYNLYLQPASSFTLRHAMERVRPGERSELPDMAPPIPPPPEGSYRMPATSSAVPAPAHTEPTPTAEAVGFGTLDVFVQPGNAELTIDGHKWVSSEEGHFVVQLGAGTHRVEVSRAGYRTFAADIEVRDGETTPLNVGLTATPR